MQILEVTKAFLINMVAHFCVRAILPNQRIVNGRLAKHNLHARDLLTSTVEDIDVVLDWWYWYDTWFPSAAHTVIPHSLFPWHCTVAVLGTITWALVASDGHLMHYSCRALFRLVRPFLIGLGSISRCMKRCSLLSWVPVIDSKKLVKKTNRLLDQQTSAGAMLLMGIVLEDVPQTILTFVLEGINQDGGLELNGLAAANCLSSLYNALIKLADAYDLRNDVLVPSGPLATWKGHDDTVSCFASINGNKFLSASYDNKVKLWKLSRGQECVREYEGHVHRVSSICTIGQDRFVTASWDYRLKVWEWSSGECIQTLKGDAFEVLAVAAMDGDLIVTGGSFDNNVKVWSISRGECIKQFLGHCDEIRALTCVGDKTTDEKYILSGSHYRDGSVKLWSLSQDDCLRTFPSPNEKSTISVSCLSVLRNQVDCFLSGSTDNSIRQWHILSGVCMRTFSRHSAPITCLAIAKDGVSFLSGSEDKTINLWNASTGEAMHTFHGHFTSVTAVVVMGNGRFVSGSQDGTVIVWAMGSGVQPQNNAETEAIKEGDMNGYVLAPD